MQCPSCDAALPDEARFCLRCGALAAPAPRDIPDPVRAALATALGRQYDIVRLLGRGGMGAVYLAREAALEREVAIKVLPPDHGATTESRERFRREARTAAKLSHPHIVPLYTFGDVDGTLFFVMGYVRGESLAARIRREGRLPVEETRRILVEIAHALEYAHGLGIVHRDIKPDNVLLEEGSGRAMLTDFGVAKALGAGQTVTQAGNILGTPHYMSPEQAQGRSDLDGRTDLYSLGVMGYTLLAGRLPFEGATPADVLVQHITKEAPPLASLASGVPQEMVSAITRCLAKDPAKRWRDAKELRDVLAGPQADEIPLPLEELSTLAYVALGCALGMLYLMAWWLGTSESRAETFFVILVAVALVCQGVIILFRVGALRRAGFDLPRIAHAVLLQPKSWFGWYPQRLRAPGDVWARLPAELRRARAWLGWTLLGGVLVFLPQMVMVVSFDSNHSITGRDAFSRQTREAISNAVLSLMMLAALASLICTWRWNRRLRTLLVDPGLKGDLLVTWTGRRSFWSQPDIRALLLSAPAATGQAPPTSPQEMVQAVARACQALPESVRPIGDAAPTAARALGSSIEALDAQLSDLAGNLDAADIARLAEKLSALGPALPTEGTERGQMRELWKTQLDFMRRLEARIEDAKARRARQVELLHRLWRAVDELRAGADGEHGTSSTERLRSLVHEIEQYVAVLGRAAVPGETARALEELPTLER